MGGGGSNLIANSKSMTFVFAYLLDFSGNIKKLLITNLGAEIQFFAKNRYRILLRLWLFIKVYDSIRLSE